MIRVEYLRDNENGIDVYISNNGQSQVIRNVHENIVRCAIGDNDMYYLLNTKTPESFCVISESDLNDFIKYQVGR